MLRPLKNRPGLSLVELLLFLGFFALTSGVVLSLLFSSHEQRVRQESVSLVDQTGVQLLQILTRRIRRAERILAPQQGQSGAVLALQMASDSENPTIILIQSGSLTVAEADAVRPLTDSGALTTVAFAAFNTSSGPGRSSVFISFTLTKIIGLPGEPLYERKFEALVTLFPDDDENGDCGCLAPACSGTGSYYHWSYCDEGSCLPAPFTLPCEQ